MMRCFPSLLILLSLFFLPPTAALAADTITGTVTNKTTNKPAVGDDVVLIRLAQGMQEATRTKTDARGRFKLDVPDDHLHLVRVTHDKANYFRPAPAGTQSVDIEVFTAAAKVEGVSEEADVMRIQSDAGGNGLEVTEHFFVKNDSTPPKTQFSDRPFEFYLPAGAVVQGSAAQAPGGMAVQSAPVPLGDANHYAFIFPIRPGETQFQISYKLAYTGSFKFAPRPVTAIDTVAVMMPKAMGFKTGPSAPYSPVNDEVNAQTYVARNVQPSQPLEFTVSGSGQLPRDTQAGQGGSTSEAAAGQGEGTAATDTRPGGGLGVPGDKDAERDPWTKYRWWILGGLGLAMAAGAGVLLRRPASKNGAATVTDQGPAASGSVGGPSALLTALKEELFALETDRLQGRLSDADYAEQKAALEVVLRRALARNETVASTGVGG